jgi:shikimate kinase
MWHVPLQHIVAATITFVLSTCPPLCGSLSPMQTDLLKPEEFDAHVKNGTCRISFIGMSNCGKSYRSKALRDELGFLWYQVDEAIQKALGLASMADISKWLGYPTSPTYQEREQVYLTLENQYTKEAAMKTNGKNFVFDTTGSVVHLAPETLEVLDENTLIVHLEVSAAKKERMLEKFFKEPKPVAWCDFFSIRAGESAEDALRRCYPTLLEERLARYRAIAHVNIPLEEVFDATGTETLAAIRRHLSA